MAALQVLLHFRVNMYDDIIIVPNSCCSNLKNPSICVHIFSGEASCG